MGKYTVTYFNARGRAEVIRMILAAAGEEFDDVRFTKEEWPEKKANYPGGVLPNVATPDGKSLRQSMAAARYLARKFGLYPTDDHEVYRTERAIGQVTDIMDELYRMYFFGSPDKLEESKKAFEEGKGKNLLKGLTEFLEEENLRFFAGDKVTLGDLTFLCALDYLKKGYPSLIEQFPRLEKLAEEALQEHPKLADWIANRPQTEM
jgi:prostaglandin-H2 D-isomerase / glutathione transferase